MSTIAAAVIDHLGGTSATAKLIESPISTVHSWRTKGIPQSRLAHIRLAAKADGKPLPEQLEELLGDRSQTDVKQTSAIPLRRSLFCADCDPGADAKAGGDRFAPGGGAA